MLEYTINKIRLWAMIYTSFSIVSITAQYLQKKRKNKVHVLSYQARFIFFLLHIQDKNDLWQLS